MATILPASRDVLRFYDKVIRDYNCGDIKWLVKRQAPTLGPLLACVGAGVDTVGGMMYGFEDGTSKKRSVRFMEEIMGLEHVVAEAIYCCARCGYMHEGIGALSLGWFADYKRTGRGVVMFAWKDDGFVVNVVELAHKYLDAVERVWRDCQSKLRYLPLATGARKSITTLSSATLPSLDDFLNEYGDGIERVRGSYSREEVLRGIHFWAYEGYDDGERDGS